MAWDESILLTFGAIPPNSLENEYSGPWNKLMHSLFPFSTLFTVSPQYLRSNSTRSADLLVTFLVAHQQRTVLIIELKRPLMRNLISTRADADRQIRQRLNDSTDLCPIPTLRGISAMGTQMAFYSLDLQDPEAEILPRRIPRNPNRVNDTAPFEWWSFDVLSEEGEAEIRRAADEIKAECAALG